VEKVTQSTFWTSLATSTTSTTSSSAIKSVY
jgi:hypothetical protein